MLKRHPSSLRLLQPACAGDPTEDGRLPSRLKTRRGLTDRDLRDAFGSFVTGVTIVTCVRPDGKPFGVTVSSFTPVSLEPPLVLVCLKRSGWSGQTIANAGCFAVNILQQDQRQVAAAFSGNTERIDEQKWASTETGIPVLEQSLGHLECVIDQVHLAGDHDIIIGRVLQLCSLEQLQPLVYYRGRYESLAPPPKASADAG